MKDLLIQTCLKCGMTVSTVLSPEQLIEALGATLLSSQARHLERDRNDEEKAKLARRLLAERDEAVAKLRILAPDSLCTEGKKRIPDRRHYHWRDHWICASPTRTGEGSQERRRSKENH